ncbi:MAG: LysM peptidoglycan-binding domain-containing protein, partial [Actinobacteria bacterium]|nr:LysM peptidoglycan-binding domain-containing protein [Actinomycetota bacterium]
MRSASPQQATAVGGHHARATTHAEPVTYVIPSDGRGPDTYWDIAAARLGSGEHWQQIWDLNRGRTQPDGEVMNNPGLLKPGWTVLLPSSAATSSPAAAQLEDVTVHDGDTLSGIAQSHGVADWHQVWQASQGMAEPGGQHLTNPDLIRPGWTLEVPMTGPSTHVPTPHVPKPQTPTQQIPTPRTPTHQTPTTPDQPTPGEQTPNGQAPTPARPSTPITPHHEQHDAPAASSSAHSSSEAPLVAFAGGGVLLAGVSLAALIRYRRRQFRWRHPGRTIGATPPPLQRVERALLSSGHAGMADVTWLNEALRSLVHALSATDTGRLPDVVAARMTAETLELVLTGAQPQAPK